MQKFDSSSKGPLYDIRVLDLSRLVAGNMLSLYLADFGADVIKVEQEGKGDDLRNWKENGYSIYWKIYGRNKRSIALDLKSDAGKNQFRKLLRTSHVLVENFVPGTLERMGLAPDDLLKINPSLVIARISGWGQTGPYKHKPGFGTLVEAMSGYATLNGFPDTPPTLPPLALADMVAGVYGAASILTALRVVDQGGKGQVIDISLFEPIFSFISSDAARYQVTGETSVRTGNQAAHTAPRNLYECSDGKYIAMSGSMQSMAMRIFEAIGRPDLKNNLKFANNDARVEHRDELDAIIGAFIKQRTQQESLDIFEKAAVTAGPVCAVSDLLDHPFVTERGVIVDVEDGELGSVPMHNIVPRFSGTPGSFRLQAPTLGEHTAQILAELDEVTND